ncbi:putative transport protein [Rhodopseudomonas faecalis]|uniref:Putative transport protein n=1 Tax=Rhodopseudomonas faecalis TaxID=99655 RepID=A0A318T998_9BRAD|nr:DUF5655 domain-containing protein [Rhodopseudomonas faecalis]PYF01123.1 putative transport protein [Rhodopseudomonas faecalis]
MSDVKLFRIDDGSVHELPGEALQVEKSLQVLFEANLEQLLGIRFLATEHSTGSVHSGRIDTLGLDEDDCPVIIEFKRAVNENVINQGLFYLDWLLDHRKEFQWLVMEKLGPNIAKDVDWSAPRLICIAGDFTRYDQHAVKQIARNIELIRYRKFDAGLLMLELVHAPKQSKSIATIVSGGATQIASVTEEAVEDPYLSARIESKIRKADPALLDLFEGVRQFLIGLGDDVQVKELKYYIAFKRLKNFTCVEISPLVRVVTLFLRLDPTTVELEEGFSRDVTKIGHAGTGNLELTLRSMNDFAKAQPLIRRAYEGS